MMRTRINEVSEQVALLRATLQAVAPHADANAHDRPPMNGAPNGGAVNGHALQPEAHFRALDQILARELRAGEAAAAPPPAAT
jgi:hypothetical protein